jgi:hypothetical protein
MKKKIENQKASRAKGEDMVYTAAIQNECDCFKHDTKVRVVANKGCSLDRAKPAGRERKWKKANKKRKREKESNERRD